MAWSYIGGTTSAQLDHTAASVALALPGGAAAGDVVVLSTFADSEATASGGLLFDDQLFSWGFLGGPRETADYYSVDWNGASGGYAIQFVHVFQLKTVTNPTISAFGLAAGDFGYARLDVFRSATGSFIADIKRRNLFTNGNKGGLVGSSDYGATAGEADTASVTQDLSQEGDDVADDIGSGDFLVYLPTMFEDDSATSLNTATDDEANGYTEAAEVKDTTGTGLHWSVNYDLDATIASLDTGMTFTVARTGGSGTPFFVCLPVFLSEVGPTLTNYSTGALTKTPSFVAASTAQVISTDTTTEINMPAGVQDGDVVVIASFGNMPNGSIDLYSNQNNRDSIHFFAANGIWANQFTYWGGQGSYFIDTSGFTADVLVVQTFAFRSVDLRVEEYDFDYGYYYGSGGDEGTSQDIAITPPTLAGNGVYADKAIHLLRAGKSDDWTSVAISNNNPGELDWTERADSATTAGPDAGLAAYTAIESADIDAPSNETITVTGGASAEWETTDMILLAEPLGTRKWTAPTFVGAGALAGPANTGTLTPDLPAGIQAGDVLVLVAGGSNTGLLGIAGDWDNYSLSQVLVTTQIASGVVGIMQWYDQGEDTTTTVTPTGNAANDNWWARVLAFRGITYPSSPYSTVPTENVEQNADNPVIPFSAIPCDMVPGVGVSVFAKADNNSGVTGPGTVDGVTWVDHTNATTSTNDDASLVIGYFLNGTEGVDALDADHTWSFSGGASEAVSGIFLFFPISLNNLYYENTETGSTIGVSVIEHDMLAEADVDGSTAVTSVVAGALQSETVITSTIPADSTISAAIMYFHQFVLTGLITCESAISSLVSFPIRIFTGAINATSAVTSSIIARVLNTFRIKSEWGTTGGGGRRRLNKDLAKVLTRPRRNQT